MGLIASPPPPVGLLKAGLKGKGKDLGVVVYLMLSSLPTRKLNLYKKADFNRSGALGITVT